MDGGGDGGIHCVVDPGGGQWVLVPHDIAELLLEKAMDPFDGEVPAGAEDVEVAGQHQVLVLVAGEAATLEVHNEGVRREEIIPKDGLLYLGDLKVPDEVLPGELQNDHPGAVAVDPGSARAPTRWCFKGERLPVERRDLGKTLVEAPVLTSMGMSKSLSVSHSRRAGALSKSRCR